MSIDSWKAEFYPTDAFYLPYEDGLVRQGGVSYRQIGTTPVIAAMRTIVTHYTGHEIYLPDELELLK